MKEYAATEWLPSKCGLGESPLYRAEDDTIFFVDIENRRVHSVPLRSGWEQRYTLHLDEPVTRLDAVAGRTDVLAAQTRLGLALLNTLNGTLQRITDVHHGNSGGGDASAALDDHVRLNDGGIDALGRWWASSMALDEEREIGRLWRFDSEEGVARDMASDNDDEKAAVINGPVWSPDDKTMYVSHTPTGKIYQYDYDVQRGSASNRRLFADLGTARGDGDAIGGMPDGMAVDVEGHVWAAANSKGQLVRLSPAGEVSATCAVPGAQMVSCPAFGGADMKTLFITSIADGDTSTGNVYRVQVDMPGIHRHMLKETP